MLLKIALAAAALMLAPAPVDYRNAEDVKAFLAQLGLAKSFGLQEQFTMERPLPGTEWIYLSSQPDGVNIAQRQLYDGNLPSSFFARVRLERFEPLATPQGNFVSRVTEYEIQCLPDPNRARIKSATDFPQREGRGKGVKVEIKDRPWQAVGTGSPVDGPIRAICLPD